MILETYFYRLNQAISYLQSKGFVVKRTSKYCTTLFNEEYRIWAEITIFDEYHGGYGISYR